MTSLNPTMRVGRQITETTRDEAEADPAARRGRRRRPRAPHARVPAPALRRPAPARDGGDRARRQPVAGHRRRADDRARRDRPGAAPALLAELRDEFGCGILFITHDLAVAAQITDRIAVLYAGRVAESGPTADAARAPVAPVHGGAARRAAVARHAARPGAAHAAGRDGARRRAGGRLRLPHPLPARARAVRDGAAAARGAGAGRRRRVAASARVLGAGRARHARAGDEAPQDPRSRRRPSAAVEAGRRRAAGGRRDRTVRCEFAVRKRPASA